MRSCSTRSMSPPRAPGCARTGENVVVEVEGEERAARAAAHAGLWSASAGVGCRPALMALCAEAGVTMAFFDRERAVPGAGRRAGLGQRAAAPRAVPPRRRPAGCAAIVRGIVAAKALNQRAVLRRALRDHGERLAADGARGAGGGRARLTDIARRADGRRRTWTRCAASRARRPRVYFGVFDHLVAARTTAFALPRPLAAGRRWTASTRCSRSSTRCWCTTAAARWRRVGLDPAVGLPAPRPAGAAEPGAGPRWRSSAPLLADRLALSLVNRRQLGAGDFRRMENGAVLLTDDSAQGRCWPPGRSASRTSCAIPSWTRRRRWACCRICRRSSWPATCAATSTPIRRSSGSEAAMLVLVSYDVSTDDAGRPAPAAPRRAACLDYGQRVQYLGVRVRGGPGAMGGAAGAPGRRDRPGDGTACASTSWAPTGSGGSSMSAPSRRWTSTAR